MFNNTFQLTITFNNSQIKTVKTIKYLGILLDQKLQFKYNISMLESKLSRFLGILYKKIVFTQKCFKKTKFYFFHSYLNFLLIIQDLII